MNKQISIIGCGWLGLPLAKQMIDNNYKVKGSTTLKEKLPLLRLEGIDAFHVELKPGCILGDIENCLKGSEILIINIPPGLRKNPENNYVEQISLLIPFIEAASISHVLFVSSISVFKDEISIPIITSGAIPNPESESGKQLVEVENLLKENKHFSTTIVRFGGLFGADRHPAKSLSGRHNLSNPEAPVNLIHLNDCIGIIQQIVVANLWDHVYNVSTKPHPSKKDYYTSICNQLNIPIPNYDLKHPSKGKLIDSNELEQILNYQLVVKLNN